MAEKYKLILGALPEQIDDYSHFEETQYHWGRVAFVVLVLSALLALGYWLFAPEVKEAAPEVAAVPMTSAQQEASVAALEPEALTATTPSNPDLPLPEQAVAVPEKRPPSPMAGGQSMVAQPLAQNDQVIKPEVHLDAASTPIQLLNSAMVRAQMTATLKDGDSGVEFGERLTVPVEGVIKVALFTEVRGLKGKVLYHDWYLDGRRQARVKKPVTLELQDSSSSKYINQQMRGAWLVKVVDQQEQVYLEAAFTVQ